MGNAADALARLRVCRAAGLTIPLDLQEELLACLESQVSAGRLRQNRDALIRRAAMLLAPASDYQHAERLADEARQMMRTWSLLKTRPAEAEPTTPRACLHAASLQAPLPKSVRQYYRVLQALRD